jgi:anti-sigma factor RsiW
MNDHLSTDLLIDFVHGELSPSDDARAHAHLTGCASCREAYELEAALGEVLRSAAQAEEREMPSLVAAAVWERVRAARPGPAARLQALFRPAFALPIAAALLIGGFFASPLAHLNRPTVDAAYYFEAHAAETSANPLSERSSSAVLETSMLVPSADGAEGGAGGLAAASAGDGVR